jgi:hypothetical protein
MGCSFNGRSGSCQTGDCSGALSCTLSGQPPTTLAKFTIGGSLVNGDGVWQQLLKNKYLRDKTLTQVQYMPGDSYFWAGLVKVKDEFLSMGRFDLGDGSQVRFWEDSWISPHPLKTLFPSLYNSEKEKCIC